MGRHTPHRFDPFTTNLIILSGVVVQRWLFSHHPLKQSLKTSAILRQICPRTPITKFPESFYNSLLSRRRHGRFKIGSSILQPFNCLPVVIREVVIFRQLFPSRIIRPELFNRAPVFRIRTLGKKIPERKSKLEHPRKKLPILRFHPGLGKGIN